MNTYSIWACGTEYICHQFWDATTNKPGVDVFDPLDNNKHIGEILNISIPDIGDEEEVTKFEKEVTEFIESNI